MRVDLLMKYDCTASFFARLFVSITAPSFARAFNQWPTENAALKVKSAVLSLRAPVGQRYLPLDPCGHIYVNDAHS